MYPLFQQQKIGKITVVGHEDQYQIITEREAQNIHFLNVFNHFKSILCGILKLFS